MQVVLREKSKLEAQAVLRDGELLFLYQNILRRFFYRTANISLKKNPSCRTAVFRGIFHRIQLRRENSISQNVEKAISRNELDKLSLYYQKKNTFQALVNQMFSSTHKEICDTADGLMFRLEDGTLLAPHELSSGEKQLLILLIFALVENNQEFITLWDEPEISLHIDWQRKLINTVHMLNPNGQLIISTHSPSIIYEGWEKMVVNMEDLIHLQIPE